MLASFSKDLRWWRETTHTTVRPSLMFAFFSLITFFEIAVYMMNGTDHRIVLALIKHQRKRPEKFRPELGPVSGLNFFHHQQ